MKTALSIIALAAAALATTPSLAKGSGGAQATLLDANGKESGQVKLTPQGKHLAGDIHVMGLTPGLRGMHIHAVGKCEGPKFDSAGGHLNPDGKQHGFDNPQGSHQGDLPELTVGADGTGHGVFTAHTTLKALFDADGASFVVHEKADDNKTDPSGNSGARILCGVLKPTKR